MAEILFWSSLLLIFYAYAGYPGVLMILSVVRSRPVKKGNITPGVSFIITAHNEETRIREKLENTLQQDYPRERLEIVVASDCSSDRTDDIVASYGPMGVRLVRASERRGKEAAQKLGVDTASGEIFVFSDVATTLPSDGVSNIVKGFYDSTVGCVSSVDKFIEADGKMSGEGAYVRYEMFLRRLETQVNSLVGLSGSFFAVRKELCQNWAVDLQSDFNTLLIAVKMGFRGVLDPGSVGYYENILDEKREGERKVRTVVRGIAVFLKSLPMLNPLRFGLFSWQLFSHKLCRWLVPFAMILGCLSNLALISHGAVYLLSAVLQVLFYAIAFGGIRTNIFSGHPILRLPSFLLLANLSILNAWYRYARGERVVAWTPSERIATTLH